MPVWKGCLCATRKGTHWRLTASCNLIATQLVIKKTRQEGVPTSKQTLCLPSPLDDKASEKRRHLNVLNCSDRNKKGNHEERENHQALLYSDILIANDSAWWHSLNLFMSGFYCSQLYSRTSFTILCSDH